MNKLRISFRLTVALTILISGLLVGLGAGGASAATVDPGPTIATAGALNTGSTASGGGGAVDFWKIKLAGGDRIQLAINGPAANFEFQLYAPEVTDGTFSTARAIATQSSLGQGNVSVYLRAPYNGTYVLAVCENMPGNAYSCTNALAGDEPGQKNPMDAYTFVPSVSSGPPPAVAARETRASTTIANASSTSVGNFESAGSNHIDFWKIPLNAGDTVKVAVGTPSGGNYLFELFPAGTSDAKFAAARAVSSGATGGNVPAAGFTLKAPGTGSYVLAVCENMPASYYSCVNVTKGKGRNPMDPYTFTTKLAGGRESVTALHLSAASVGYGHERTVKFAVAVKGMFGGAATGKAGISVGQTLCTVKLAGGKGSCSLASATALKPGRYSVRAFYAGSYLASKSGAAVLTVHK